MPSNYCIYKRLADWRL